METIFIEECKHFQISSTCFYVDVLKRYAGDNDIRDMRLMIFLLFPSHFGDPADKGEQQLCGKSEV